jgi:hypothetical protein
MNTEVFGRQKKSHLKFTHLQQGDVVIIHVWVVQMVRYDLGHPVQSSTCVMSAWTSPELQVCRLQLYSLFRFSVTMVQ